MSLIVIIVLLHLSFENLLDMTTLELSDYLLVAHNSISVSPSGVLQDYDYTMEMELLYIAQ